MANDPLPDDVEPDAVEGANEWDDYAADWDHDEAAQTYASEAFASLLTVLAGRERGLEGARVIDFGCGTGLLTEQLVAAGAKVDAVDTSAAMRRVLQDKIEAHGWTNVRVSDELPQSATSFDLVVCSSVCSFLDDYPAVAAQLVALLREDGLFVQWDWERDDTDAESHGLARAEITDALNDAGLDEVEVDAAFAVAMHGQTMQPLMGHGWQPAPPVA